MTSVTSPPSHLSRFKAISYVTIGHNTISAQPNRLTRKKFNGIFSQIQDQEKNHYLVPTSIDNDIQRQKEEAVAETQEGRKPGPSSFFGAFSWNNFQVPVKGQQNGFLCFCIFPRWRLF